jgi:hypothetical protein
VYCDVVNFMNLKSARQLGANWGGGEINEKLESAQPAYLQILGSGPHQIFLTVKDMPILPLAVLRNVRAVTYCPDTSSEKQRVKSTIPRSLEQANPLGFEPDSSCT